MRLRKRIEDWLALRIYSVAMLLLPVKDKVRVMANVDNTITFPCMISKNPYDLKYASKLLAINSRTYSRIAARKLKN